MNVNDANATTEYPSDKLMSIVHRQDELMRKYEPIEKANGLLQTEAIPVDLDDRFGQARLKDFAWRVTEEIAEATEAMVIHSTIPIHAKEELGDALHFLIELDLLVGMDFDDEIVGRRLRQVSLALDLDDHPVCGLDAMFRTWPRKEQYVGANMPQLIRSQAYDVIETLGRAMNCLKQKPWKQTHMLTDQRRFKGLIADVNIKFFYLCSLLMDANELYDVYCRKKQVNDFRIASKY